jgi:hypothetical protein
LRDLLSFLFILTRFNFNRTRLFRLSARFYTLTDNYAREVVGVVPETKELNDLLFDCRNWSPIRIDRYYEYIAMAAAAAAPACPRMLAGAGVAYAGGWLREYAPYVIAKWRIRRLLDDPACAEFLRAL